MISEFNLSFQVEKGVTTAELKSFAAFDLF